MSAILHLNLHRQYFAAIVAKTKRMNTAAAPIAPADLAAQFARAKPADVTEILKTLETFGRARKVGDGKFKA